jgi:D-alanyl-D-alanine carboxypeptidase
VRAAGLFSLLLSTGLAGCAAGSHGAADPGSLDDRLYALLDSAFGATAGVPGVMLRVEAPRRGFVWEHALGLSDRDEGTALRPTHALRIASITKTCVAASVLRLVEEGALELDDPVEAHLSPSTCRTLRAGGYDPGAISVRMLMQHTSGLADHATADAFLARILGDPSHRWTRQEQLQLAMEVGDPLGAPGHRVPLQRHRLSPYPCLSPARSVLTSTWEPSTRRPSTPPWTCSRRQARVHPRRDGHLLPALFNGGVFRDPDTVSRMVAITPASLSADEGGYGMGIARARYAGIDCVGHGGYWGTLIRYCPEGDLLVTGAATSTRGRDMLDGVVGQRLLLLLGREATSAAGL